jgi:hypothetical protein
MEKHSFQRNLLGLIGKFLGHFFTQIHFSAILANLCWDMANHQNGLRLMQSYRGFARSGFPLLTNRTSHDFLIRKILGSFWKVADTERLFANFPSHLKLLPEPKDYQETVVRKVLQNS